MTFFTQTIQQFATSLIWPIVVIVCMGTRISWGEETPSNTPPQIISPETSENHNLRFRNIDNEKLSQIYQIWSINEDDQGFIWITGARGVARFDGLNFKLFQYDPANPYSLPEGYIVDFLQTNDHQMWFATYKGLYNFDPMTEHFTKIDLTTDSGVSTTVLRDLHPLPDGSFLIGHLGFGIGQYFPITRKYIIHSEVNAENIDGAPPNSHVLHRDKEGYIWVGSDRKLTRFDMGNKTTVDYQHTDNDNSMLSGLIMSLGEDANGNIWVGTEEGVSKLNKKDNAFTNYIHDYKNPYSLGGKNISDLEFQDDGHVWCISDGGGISLYDPKLDRFYPFKADQEVTGFIKSNAVRRAYISKSGDLWLGYHPYGISVSNRYANAFKIYNKKDNIGSINAVTQVKPNELWVGSEQGIHHLNLMSNATTHYQHIPGDKNSLSSNAVLTLLMDSSSRLWAGTWGGGLNLINVDENQYTHLKHDDTNKNSIPSNRVWSVLERDKNSLWVGTERGLSIYDIEQKSFIPVDAFTSRIGKMQQYHKDTLLILDDNDLRALNTNSMKVLELSNKWSQLPEITNFYINSKNEIWINTENGVWFQKDLTSNITGFSEDGDIAVQYYSQIITDNQGDVWLGNSQGITRYDLKTRQYTSYKSEHGLPGNVFRGPRAAQVLSDGKIAMGGAEGLVIFDPKKVYREEISATPILINLKVLDHLVDLNAPDSPLKKIINRADDIHLNSHQNVFSIEYTALEYQLSNKTQFSFRLTGFDNDWRFVEKQRVATYTNLDPGDYTFELKAANDQGIWSEHIASINIHVASPWFKTWWAYTLYIIGFVFVLCLVAYGIWSKHQRQQERKVTNKLKEIDLIKDDFMAKTSHELRTPLNGIIGLTEAIINGSTGAIPHATADKLKVVVNSGKRLSNIINDILDFSKLREHEITLNYTEVDTYDLVCSILTLSEPLIGNKKIEFINKIPKTITPIHADEQRLNQIFFNLIGNSIKFTECGSITLKAVERGTNVIFSISDTGQGIKKEDQENIFKPFEQSMPESSGTHVGTGLGLTVTKQLVELHNGEIYLESIQGKGSTFSFSIPIFSTASSVTPKESSSQKPQVNFSQTLLPSSINSKLITRAKENILRPRILVVDDEAVNRMVLEAYLGQTHFEIIECANGKQALETVKQEGPFQLVLLDVMMPDISGYEVCQKLREAFSLVELPIIFLTAKAQLDDMNRGYQVGANDFLYKPVVREEFLAKIKIHLQARAAYQSAIEAALKSSN